MLKGGEHLLRLIDEVLDLSRIEAGRVAISPEPVGVRRGARRGEDHARPDGGARRVRSLIEPHLCPTLPQVIADRTRFTQILMNYGSNAIKYGRQGGTRHVPRPRADGRVRQSHASWTTDRHPEPTSRQGSSSRSSAPARRPGPIEGTGIGLDDQQAAGRADGRRTSASSSTEGEGSEFWVELPVARWSETGHRATSRRGPEHARERRSRWHGGARYLIVYVEDNPSNIAFMEDLLADFERVELLTAPTAEIGIELVRARQPARRHHGHQPARA